MKIILIVLDGVGDRPVKELDYQTPLEYANLPNMDELAGAGICGLMDVLDPGVPPGSDTSQMTFLGNNAYEFYSGRGALEALGGGVDVSPDDVCFRTNFSTVTKDASGKYIVENRRAGREIPHASEIIDIISHFKSPYDDVEARVIHTTQHRGALILSGHQITHEIGDTDPHEKHKPVHVPEIDQRDEAQKRTRKIIMDLQDFVYEQLKDHPINEKRETEGKPPVNFLLVRGGGTLPRLTQFARNFGIKGAFISGNSLINGVCLATGLYPAMTDEDTNYEKKNAVADSVLESHDFLFFHVKETDNRSHDKDPKGVVSALEKIDKAVIAKFLKRDLNDSVIGLTGDHTTWSATGRHCGDPVPIAIWGHGVRPDDVNHYDERSVNRGGLHRIQGKHLLRTLCGYGDINKKFGS